MHLRSANGNGREISFSWKLEKLNKNAWISSDSIKITIFFLCFSWMPLIWICSLLRVISNFFIYKKIARVFFINSYGFMRPLAYILVLVHSQWARLILTQGCSGLSSETVMFLSVLSFIPCLLFLLYTTFTWISICSNVIKILQISFKRAAQWWESLCHECVCEFVYMGAGSLIEAKFFRSFFFFAERLKNSSENLM